LAPVKAAALVAVLAAQDVRLHLLSQAVIEILVSA